MIYIYADIDTFLMVTFVITCNFFLLVLLHIQFFIPQKIVQKYNNYIDQYILKLYICFKKI